MCTIRSANADRKNRTAKTHDGILETNVLASSPSRSIVSVLGSVPLTPFRFEQRDPKLASEKCTLPLLVHFLPCTIGSQLGFSSEHLVDDPNAEDSGDFLSLITRSFGCFARTRSRAAISSARPGWG